MALEQLMAYREGRSQAELGETRILQPDNFPLLLTSELQEEHHTISAFIESVGHSHHGPDVHGNKILARMCATDVVGRTRYCLGLIERAFAYDAKLTPRENYIHSGFFDYGPAAEAVATLFDKGVDADRVAPAILEWFTSYRFNYYATPAVERVVHWAAKRFSDGALPDELRALLITLRGQFSDVDYHPAQTFMALQRRTDLTQYPQDAWLEPQLDALIGEGLWLVLAPCEVWAKGALTDLQSLPALERENWVNLLKHCRSAKSARPSAKWLNTGKCLLDAVGIENFIESVTKWFAAVPKGRGRPTLGMSWENIDEQQRMHQDNATVLRGLLWLCPSAKHPDVVRSISSLASVAYRKIRGLGPRAVKVGNAAVYALSEIGSLDAVGQLAILQAKVKFGSGQKELEKAFNVSAERLGLPRADIEEMAVPTYGLSEVGVAEDKFGDFTARLTVISTHDMELVWIKPDGKTQRSVPAAVKEHHKDDLKELQAAAKDIVKMLPAQKERIDSMFLQPRRWNFTAWRERYLNHPLVGILARRLLWNFTSGDETQTGIWFNDHIVDLDLQPLKGLDDESTVHLWHPIDRSTEEIAAWRSWLDTQQIQQPFKQAHREIYLLTDAERNTRVYSNRYAAHVLKQHQFNALCALRGWKNKLRLLVDDEFPPATLHLPQWNLRAEFWIEGIGTDYGNDTNESGVFDHVATDQVRFYPVDAAQRTAHAGGGGYHPGYRQNDSDPLPLEQIPPLVFSEVMRDVDMFVGVASVGNDPTWADGGPDGRFRDYWQDYSFGILNASAKTRKEVLERLVPRLKIAQRCSFDEKFLVVKGDLRTYRIHLGSGNILMEPNDQYLCIVPKQGTADDGKVLLPFEGDRTLSIILSKAFLLAEDAKIKDETILTQVKRG